MNRGLMRASKPVLPNVVTAHLRVKAPTGTRTGTDLVGGGALVQDSLQVSPSQPGIPHLVLGPTGFLGSSPNTGSVTLFPAYINTTQAQLVVARLAGLDDNNNGFRYVIINNGCAYIDSLTLGPNATNQNIHLGSTNISGVSTFVGIGHNFPALQTDIKAQLHVQLNDQTTNVVTSVVIVDHSSGLFGVGTPTTGFGSQLQFLLQSSTTVGRNAGGIQSSWVVATDASRTSRLALFASDSAADREVIRVEADGSAGRLGFFAATAVVQQANASQAAITAVTDANAKSALQAIYNLLKNYALAPATA